MRAVLDFLAAVAVVALVLLLATVGVIETIAAAVLVILAAAAAWPVVLIALILLVLLARRSRRVTDPEIRRSIDREHTRLSDLVRNQAAIIENLRNSLADRLDDLRAEGEQLGRERRGARLEVDALRTELSGERARRERAEAELGRFRAHFLAPTPDARPDGQARVPARERACGDCRCQLCEG